MVKKPFEVFLSIFVICCQEFCKKHSRRDKDNHFSKPFEFPKTGHTLTEKNVNFGRPEIGALQKIGFESINYFSGSIPN